MPFMGAAVRIYPAWPNMYMMFLCKMAFPVSELENVFTYSCLPLTFAGELTKFGKINQIKKSKT